MWRFGGVGGVWGEVLWLLILLRVTQVSVFRLGWPLGGSFRAKLAVLPVCPIAANCPDESGHEDHESNDDEDDRIGN